MFLLNVVLLFFLAWFGGFYMASFVAAEWGGDGRLFRLVLVIVLFVLGTSGIPIVATARPSVKEFGAWRLKKEGHRSTMRDPQVIQWQGCLYRCELIEESVKEGE